jgi:two-component system response regulator FixJ
MTIAPHRAKMVGIVDDHEEARESLAFMLRSAGYSTICFASAEALLAAMPPMLDCLIVDVVMPGGMDGVSLVEHLHRGGSHPPVLVVSGHGDIPLAVRAMRAGAVDFIEKPYNDLWLLDAVSNAMTTSGEVPEANAVQSEASARVATLSARERDVLCGLLGGKSNKMIGQDLGISNRTVEVYRAHLMDKLGARSLPDVLRIAMAAGLDK